MEKFTVAAVQMNALRDDLEHNLQVHRRIIAEAARAGAHLVAFPELSATGHYGDESVVQFAEPPGSGPVFETLRDEARRHETIVGYGFAEIAHGTYYNAYALVGPEGLLGLQRKVHASYDEYFSFRMGRSFEVFDLPFGRLGVLVCYDSDIFESWRVLALKGADVVLLPHASRAGFGEKVEPEELKGQLAERLDGLPGQHGVYAKANALFAVYGNQVDYNGHSTHQGGAWIIGPDGKLIEKSSVSLDDLWIGAELDPAVQQEVRRSPWCTLKMRRPEMYGEITRMI